MLKLYDSREKQSFIKVENAVSEWGECVDVTVCNEFGDHLSHLMTFTKDGLVLHDNAKECIEEGYDTSFVRWEDETRVWSY